MIDLEKLKYDLAMNAALAEVIKNSGVGNPASLMPIKFLQAYEQYDLEENLPQLENVLKVINHAE